jgi:hypothetical protein
MRGNDKMKFFLALIAISFIGSLSAMDYSNHSCVTLLLNNDYSIKGSHEQAMTYYVKSSEFLGKSIFDTINCSEDGKNALKMGFLKAVKQNRTVNVAYSTTRNHQGLVTITPIAKKTKKNFFVQIQQLDNQ